MDKYVVVSVPIDENNQVELPDGTLPINAMYHPTTHQLTVVGLIEIKPPPNQQVKSEDEESEHGKQKDEKSEHDEQMGAELEYIEQNMKQEYTPPTEPEIEEPGVWKTVSFAKTEPKDND